MRALLLVEGPSDRSALTILARKILANAQVGVDARVVGRDDMFKPRKVEAHIRVAVSRKQDTTKAILCIDSECTEIVKTGARIGSVAQEVDGRLSQLSVKAVMVDHALEGWFLNDKGTLAQYLGIPQSRLNYGNPENECRPALVMGKVFGIPRRHFLKTRDLPVLAERADPAEVSRLSPTFEIFRRALLED